MASVLVFNPGSNSLKFELVEIQAGQVRASQGRKLASAALDDVGKDGTISVYDTSGGGHAVMSTETCKVADMEEAASAALRWIGSQPALAGTLHGLACAAVRVVHGGERGHQATEVTPEILHQIETLEELAPLHNRSSLAVLRVLRRELPGVRQAVVFDTAFHRTLPEVAWRYPIERAVADRYGIRKYGFHGISHRYMLEQYAATAGKPVEEVTLVSLHLESGCSACAISRGRSVDTTMGMTPLEGLMMGTRSGSVDPGILPYLVGKGEKLEEVMTLLNKRSGLLGVAGGTLDTRDLVKRNDDAAKLALAMFSYRVRLAVGAYLAALGEAEAVLFGGGIGEDSPWLRAEVCEGLKGWGLELDAEANRSEEGMVRITKPGSRLAAWAMPVEESLQIAHEYAEANRLVEPH